MSRDAFTLLGGLFAQFWRLFNSWYIPGTRMTPAEMGFFLLAASVTLRFFTRLFRTSEGDSGGKK